MKYVYFLSVQDCVCDSEDRCSAMTGSEIGTHEFLKSIRETFPCVKSNLMPAAFYWYRRCAVFAAAGYTLYNPPTKSDHLLHNGAARTCQQTVAQFYLSIATGSLAPLLRFGCSWDGWRNIVAFSALTGSPLARDVCQIEGKDSNLRFTFPENGISHCNSGNEGGGNPPYFFHKIYELACEEKYKLLHGLFSGCS